MPKQEPTNRIRHGPLTWKKGDPILARDLTAMADQVFRVIEGGRGIEITKMGNGIIVSSTAQAARGGSMSGATGAKFAKFIGFSGPASNPGVAGDVIKCFFYDPVTNTSGDVVFVAMPWMLRRTPFDNLTISYKFTTTVSYVYSNSFTRDATVGEVTREQIITPNYYGSEVIRIQHGATGLSEILEGTPIVWEDMNTCGRFWAEEPV